MNEAKIRYWKIKVFKTKEDYDKWMTRNYRKYQIQEIFVNNCYRGVEYRELLKINIL